jgi:hypothetical protein
MLTPQGAVACWFSPDYIYCIFDVNRQRLIILAYDEMHQRAIPVLHLMRCIIALCTCGATCTKIAQSCNAVMMNNYRSNHEYSKLPP